MANHNPDLSYEIFNNSRMAMVALHVANKDPDEPFMATWLARELEDNLSGPYPALRRLRGAGLVGPPLNGDGYQRTILHRLDSRLWLPLGELAAAITEVQAEQGDPSS
jgi:hypothetical protein